MNDLNSTVVAKEAPVPKPVISVQEPHFDVSIARVINNRRLRRYQHVHSLVFSFAGLFGVLAAVCIAIFVKPISLMDIGIFLLFFFLVGMGLTIGYHRHFTHKSFKAARGVRATLGVLGCMAGQGPIVFWVALHRMHHEFSDREGDPHSPNLFGGSFWQRARGLVHAYIGWTVQHEVPNANFYARDLLADPVIMPINRLYYLWIVLGLALPAMLGALLTFTWMGALEGFLWGGLVRMFALHNIIWWITSFAHVFGTHDFISKDLSTNNFWIAVPTLGESWHNSHHSFPSAAILNFRWWHIDISGMVIAALEKTGWLWDVQRPKPGQLQARRVALTVNLAGKKKR